MAKKTSHFTVTVEKISIYKVDVDATSEEKAMKAAEKAVKNEDVEPENDFIEAIECIEEDSSLDDEDK